jgi:hypothetical protein
MDQKEENMKLHGLNGILLCELLNRILFLTLCQF